MEEKYQKAPGITLTHEEAVKCRDVVRGLFARYAPAVPFEIQVEAFVAVMQGQALVVKERGDGTVVVFVHTPVIFEKSGK